MKHDQNEVVAYLLDTLRKQQQKSLSEVANEGTSRPLLDINAVNEAWQTSLTMAAVNNNLETVERLIAAGADVNIRDKVGESGKVHHLPAKAVITLFTTTTFSKGAAPPTGRASRATTRCWAVCWRRALTPT